MFLRCAVVGACIANKVSSGEAIWRRDVLDAESPQPSDAGIGSTRVRKCWLRLGRSATSHHAPWL